jgi:hypothetical protein
LDLGGFSQLVTIGALEAGYFWLAAMFTIDGFLDSGGMSGAAFTLSAGTWPMFR